MSCSNGLAACLPFSFVCLLWAPSTFPKGLSMRHERTHFSTRKVRKMDPHKYCRVGIHAVTSQLMSTTEKDFFPFHFIRPCHELRTNESKILWQEKVSIRLDSSELTARYYLPPHRILFSDTYLNLYVSMARFIDFCSVLAFWTNGHFSASLTNEFWKIKTANRNK